MQGRNWPFVLITLTIAIAAFAVGYSLRSYPVHAQEEGGEAPADAGSALEGGMGMDMGMGAEPAAPPPPPPPPPPSEPPIPSPREVERLEWTAAVEARWEAEIRPQQVDLALMYASQTVPRVSSLRPGSSAAIGRQIETWDRRHFGPGLRAVAAREGRSVPKGATADNLAAAMMDDQPQGAPVNRYYRAHTQALSDKAARLGRELADQIPDDTWAEIVMAAEASLRRTTRLQPGDTAWDQRLQEEIEHLAVRYTMGPNAASEVQEPYYRPPALPSFDEAAAAAEAAGEAPSG